MTPRQRHVFNRRTLAALEAVGLDATQQDVYFTLLANPHSRPREVAERCNRSPQEVQHVLQGLAADGLVVRSAGQVARYQAVSPATALHGRVTSAARAADDARRTVDELEHLFRRAVHSAHPASLVEVVHGSANIAARSRQMEDDARIQLRTFDTPPYVVDLRGPAQPIHFGNRADLEYRCIYDRAALAIPGRLENEIASGIAAGEQARAVTRLPIKMILSDDVGALVPAALSSDVLDAAFYIAPCPVLDALIALFELTWQHALPIGEAASRPQDEHVPHAELLPLLAAGHTDFTIASTLQISVRTVQRRVSELMSELGVTTRFQAGMAIARRGWLD